MIKLRIKNLDKLQKALKMAPVAMKMGIANSIKKSAFLVEEKSKRVTPVDTGDLRRSTRAWDIRPFRAAIYPKKEYAIFVHEGTRYMKGRPFMKWGLSSAKKQIESLFSKAIYKVLKGIELKTKI